MVLLLYREGCCFLPGKNGVFGCGFNDLEQEFEQAHRVQLLGVDISIFKVLKDVAASIQEEEFEEIEGRAED